MASESRLQLIAGESESEAVSEKVAVGSAVHEVDSEALLLVDNDDDSVTLKTRVSDRELVRETVRGRLDDTVEEKVPVNVTLSVASRLSVSDEIKVRVNVAEADCVLSEWEVVGVLDIVGDSVGVEGTESESVAEIVAVSEVEGLGEALNVGGGEMVTLRVTVFEIVWLAVGISVPVTDAEGDADGDIVEDGVNE